MNKKEMKKKIEDQERHIASLQRAKAAAEQKTKTREAQIAAAKSWINALAARIGEEFDLDIDEIKKAPEYKYRRIEAKIEMKKK